MNDQARRIAEALLDEYKLGHNDDESRNAKDFDDAELEDVAAVVEKAMGDQWIPVTERLPEADSVAAFLAKVRGMYYPEIMGRCPTLGWISREGRKYAEWEVTHWMPLPAPPEVE